MKFLLASLKTFLNLSKDFSESRIKISVLAFMFFHWLDFFSAHVKDGFRIYFSDHWLLAFRTVLVFPAAFGIIFRITDSFRRKFYSHRWLPEEGFSKDYQNKQLFHRNQQKLYPYKNAAKKA